MAYTVVEIGCMDFRLNGAYANGNDVVHLRNAGGSVGGFAEELKALIASNPSIKDIVIIDHRDCGGLKVAQTMLHTPQGKNELGITDESHFAFEKTLASHFRARGLENAPMGALEMENPSIQVAVAKRILQELGREGIRVSAKLLDVPSGLHADAVTVAIGVSGRGYRELAEIAGVTPSGSYFIQATNPDDIKKDLEVAVTVMGKKDVRFLALDRDTQQRAESFVRSLKAERYMVDIEPRMFSAYKERVK